MLKGKSPKRSDEEAGRTTGIKSLVLSFLMLYSSCNNVSPYNLKKSMCLVSSFSSKAKRESLRNVTLSERLQQLSVLRGGDP